MSESRSRSRKSPSRSRRHSRSKSCNFDHACTNRFPVHTGRFSPMLASTVNDIDSLVFPVAATEKIDGIRAIMLNGKLVSRSLKPIPNRFIKAQLEAVLPDGADGEILTGSIQQTTSDVMSFNKPVTDFTFFWFDVVNNKPYLQRMTDICNFKVPQMEFGNIVKHVPHVFRSKSELNAFERRIVDAGGEGVIVRDLCSPYKFGRSTVREGFMLKLKRFTDAEAKIVGFEELQHEDGTRSNMLGAFVAVRNGVQFKIGTGFSTEQRRDFWRARKSLLGKLVKFKFFEVGVKAAPRHPVFLAFRNRLDL